MARATSLVAIVASATGFSLAPWSVLAPRRARALAATHIVDFDCLVDTMNLELSVNLEVLQTVRPDPSHPWNAVSEVPTHKFRTFDMARKYTRLLSEMRRAARPALLLDVPPEGCQRQIWLFIVAIEGPAERLAGLCRGAA